MKPSLALQSHRSAIRNVVELHHACNARVFGSVANGNDVEGSDLDVLMPRCLPEKFRSIVLAEAVPV